LAEPSNPQALTTGPHHHWFGYYDKLQFSPSGRFVLGMEVDFEHRSPMPEDEVTIGMIDLEDQNRWIDLGRSRAWCWQQGCMLQWIPGSETEIIWNDREDGRFVSHILDTSTGSVRTIPSPVYTLSPDGKTAFATDFARNNDTRPGYGYAGFQDPNHDVLAPEDSGIWRVDLQTGEPELLVTLAEIAAMPFPQGDISQGKHWFNHLLVSPDGSRLEFLHRWTSGPGRQTRMLTCSPDGKDVRIVDDCGLTSHFIWLDNIHILAWSRAHSDGGDFCRFDERTGDFEPVGSGLMEVDGHVNCLPDAEWIVNDTYPDKNRVRGFYLYHLPTNTRVDVAGLLAPPEYDGEWRCDLHPRLSPDGRSVTVDSAHEGFGRQMYLIDIGELVG